MRSLILYKGYNPVWHWCLVYLVGLVECRVWWTCDHQHRCNHRSSVADANGKGSCHQWHHHPVLHGTIQGSTTGSGNINCHSSKKYILEISTVTQVRNILEISTVTQVRTILEISTITQVRTILEIFVVIQVRTILEISIVT